MAQGAQQIAHTDQLGCDAARSHVVVVAEREGESSGLVAEDLERACFADAAVHQAALAVEGSEALGEIFHQGRPDLVLLGIGDDGHTASLFPGTEALDAVSGVYLANWVEEKGTWRLTASMPLLWSAREIVFLVQGANKASILSEIIDDGHPHPAQRVADGADSVRWMIDSAAAARLRSVPR